MSLEAVDFTGAQLDQVYFQGVTLDHVTFARARLDNVWFAGSTFHSVDLSQTELSGAHLKGSSYDCSTHFPNGFRPDRAGMIALSNRCNGHLTPRDYSGLSLQWEGKALSGSRFDGVQFEGASLPSDPTDVSLKRVRAVWTKAEETVPRDIRYNPGQCDTGIQSLTSQLIKVQHLDRAKLEGVAIELFDAAAATLAYNGPAPETVITRLKRANLAGAILKCGPGEDQDLNGWHKMARQATARQKIFLAGLRTVKGVVIDESCIGLQ